MNYNLYTVYDRLAGQYAEPHVDMNHATATRWFTSIMNQSKLNHSDFDLVCLGQYNMETGLLFTLDKPEFVVNGGTVVNG